MNGEFDLGRRLGQIEAEVHSLRDDIAVVRKLGYAAFVAMAGINVGILSTAVYAVYVVLRLGQGD